MSAIPPVDAPHPLQPASSDERPYFHPSVVRLVGSPWFWGVMAVGTVFTVVLSVVSLLFAIAVLAAGLLLAAALLAASWCSGFRYALANEPFFCLFFFFPFYFIRYAILTLPHTKPAVGFLIAGMAVMLFTMFVIFPLQVAGTELARRVFGDGKANVVADNAPRNTPAEPGPENSGGAAQAVAPVVSHFPVNPPPFIPPGTKLSPNAPPPAAVLPTPEKARVPRSNYWAKQPKSVDEALANLDSSDEVARKGAQNYFARERPDSKRTDVATKLLDLADKDPSRDKELADGIMRWGGPSHFERMKAMALRMEGYQVGRLLMAMVVVNEASTLDLCAKLLEDPDNRSSARFILITKGAASEPSLIPQIASENRDARRTVGGMLAIFGSPKSLEPLKAQLQVETDEVIQSTIKNAIEAIERRAASAKAP